MGIEESIHQLDTFSPFLILIPIIVFVLDIETIDNPLSL